jgi:catalase
VLGASSRLLEKAGITPALGSGAADPGVLVRDGNDDALDAFVEALARHRHYERETDPPVV